MSVVRVFKIPPQPSDRVFFLGKPQAFIPVVWFRDDNIFSQGREVGREEWELLLREFIAKKSYINGSPLLVLGRWSFTIGYSAP